MTGMVYNYHLIIYGDLGMVYYALPTLVKKQKQTVATMPWCLNMSRFLGGGYTWNNYGDMILLDSLNIYIYI